VHRGEQRFVSGVSNPPNVSSARRLNINTSAMQEHWIAVHVEQGAKEFRATFEADRTALVVAGALLMTVDFAALAMSRTSYYEQNTRNVEVTYVYLVAIGVATACSVGLILVGSLQFIVMRKFGARDPLDIVLFLASISPVIFDPANLMVISCFATLIGASCGVYLLQGWEGCLAFCIPCSVLFIACFFVAWNAFILADTRFRAKVLGATPAVRA
jgi:hypothetical protein